MCMTKAEIYAYCVELSVKNNDCFDIPIIINNRLTKTLGRLIFSINQISGYCENKRLEISGKLLETTAKEDIIQVIKHEWAHYYITKITHANHGHDSLFQQVCAKIGCTHDKPKNKVERVVDNDKIYKYTMYCKNCGAFLGGKQRMCPQLRQLSWAYQCPKCKSSNLFFKTNW